MQRTLVQHVGLAVGLCVIDQQPRLEVLTVVGEVGAEQLRIATRTGEPHRRRGAHHVTAERDRDVRERGVLAKACVVSADVHHVVVPVGDPDHAEGGRIADDELDVVGVGSAAAQIHHDGRPGELLHPDLEVAICRGARTGTGDGDLDGLGHLGVACHGHDRRLVERRECLRRNPIRGNTGLAESFVTTTDGLHRDARPFHHLDRGTSGRRRGTVVQPTQPLERSESPQFVAAAGHLEGVDVERTELLALVLDDAFGSFGQILSHYPTAPSI